MLEVGGRGGREGGRTRVNVNVNVNVNNLLAISESDFDNSGEPGPQAVSVSDKPQPWRPQRRHTAQQHAIAQIHGVQP